jgi:hypothetical protein
MCSRLSWKRSGASTSDGRGRLDPVVDFLRIEFDGREEWRLSIVSFMIKFRKENRTIYYPTGMKFSPCDVR